MLRNEDSNNYYHLVTTATARGQTKGEIHMKSITTLALIGLLSTGGTLCAKDLDIKGSRLEKAIGMVYAEYKAHNCLDKLPEGINYLHKAMHDGNYTFSTEQLDAFKNWQLFYYPIQG